MCCSQTFRPLTIQLNFLQFSPSVTGISRLTPPLVRRILATYQRGLGVLSLGGWECP
jgi:hypothetical protein